MYEMSKSLLRRFRDGPFTTRYFKGKGIDIGGAPDPISQYMEIFPLIKSCRTWDLPDGDAQYMQSIVDDTYDFVVSSHCLEHMVDVEEALKNWIRITKPGGFLIITIPDEDLYERGVWPSDKNTDHKHTFTIYKKSSWSPVSINLCELVQKYDVAVERLVLVSDFFRTDRQAMSVDQTLTPVAECSIEMILRKL